MSYRYTTNIIEKKAESTSFAVTAAYEYDAFGGLVSGTGGEADSNAFRYNGQYTDEETGLIYLRNRYYDPSIGRFTQEDTYWNPGNMIYGDQQFEDGEIKIPDYYAIVQSANLYVYCANDPVNGIDPFELYDRWAAVNYALYWSVNSNIYEGPIRFAQDCTNFVSWCLDAGFLHRSDDWYFNGAIGNGDYVWGSYSATWTVSDEQFKAFTNCTGDFPNSTYANGPAICLHDSQWIPASIQDYNIQPGDLLYLLNPETNKMGHTAMIVSTDNGIITYAQHDNDKNNGNLNEYLDTHNSPWYFNTCMLLG